MDGPQQFSRIRQFGPKFEMSRGPGFCFKRFVIFGHDGVKYTFAVQQPAARWVRREDRVMQLFRTFNQCVSICYRQGNYLLMTNLILVPLHVEKKVESATFSSTSL